MKSPSAVSSLYLHLRECTFTLLTFVCTLPPPHYEQQWQQNRNRKGEIQSHFTALGQLCDRPSNEAADLFIKVTFLLYDPLFSLWMEVTPPGGWRPLPPPPSLSSSSSKEAKETPFFSLFHFRQQVKLREQREALLFFQRKEGPLEADVGRQSNYNRLDLNRN